MAAAAEYIPRIERMKRIIPMLSLNRRIALTVRLKKVEVAGATAEPKPKLREGVEIVERLGEGTPATIVP